MKITEQIQGEINIILLHGRLDAHTCNSVEVFIRERIEDGRRKFVVNMENVEFIDSAGLRVILVIARDLRSKYKGDMHIAILQPAVSRVFEISGLNNVLYIYRDAENAIKSFSSTKNF